MMDHSHMSVAQWGVLEQQIQRLALGHTNAVKEWAHDHEEDYPDLANWLTGRLGGEVSVDGRHPYSALTQCGLGWSALYRGHFSRSEDHFKQVLEGVQADELPMMFCDATLGLARVYTKVGSWSLARQWCLYSLFYARRHQRSFDVARGYGALGEILLRGGHPNEALECFKLAYRVMPAGASQRSRQLNYIASALARQSGGLKAKLLLTESYQLAKDTHDHISQWHALARLQFLNLRKDKKTDVLNEYESPSNEPTNATAATPKAFLKVGRAALFDPNSSCGQRLLQEASKLFSDANPAEQNWCQYLLGQRSAKTKKALCHYAPPEQVPSVFDNTWTSLDLNSAPDFFTGSDQVLPKDSSLVEEILITSQNFPV